MSRPEWLTLGAIGVSAALCGLVLWLPARLGAFTQRIERADEATRRSNELVRQSNERRIEHGNDVILSNEITREAIAEYLRVHSRSA